MSNWKVHVQGNSYCLVSWYPGDRHHTIEPSWINIPKLGQPAEIKQFAKHRFPDPKV